MDAKTVRILGRGMGFGRLMQLVEQEWRSVAGDGTEHSVGPCAALLMPCPCARAAGCEWCGGSNRITERVARAIREAAPSTDPTAGAARAAKPARDVVGGGQPMSTAASPRQQVSGARLREISGGVDIEVSAWPDDAKAPSLADEMQAMATELLSARDALRYHEEAARLRSQTVVPFLDERGQRIGDALFDGLQVLARVTDPAAAAVLRASCGRQGVSLGYRVEPVLAVPAPGTLVRVTDGDRAGFVGVVQPSGRDDATGWTRVRSQAGLCETRIFESKYLEPVW